MKSLQVSIWTTTACNLNCSYCYEKKNRSSLKMDFQTLIEVIGFISQHIVLHNFSTCNIRFHGGEPLLNESVIWDFIQQFRSCTNIPTRYSLTTNGTLLNDKILEQLTTYFSEISVSLDGDKGVHCFHRKDNCYGGTYETILDNIKVLLSRKKNIAARMTITPQTINKLYDSILFILDLGINVIYPILDFFDANWSNELINYYFNTLDRVNLFLLESHRDSYIAGSSKTLPVLKKKCGGGISELHIFCNGDIYPCSIVVGDHRYICGNVKSGIKTDWVEQLDHINQVELEECLDCALQPYCSTNRCRFINKMVTGLYDRPSPQLCRFEKLQFVCNQKL